VTVNIHQAKTQLSKLLQRVESGEEVVIARAGKPVARLVRVPDAHLRRTPGLAKGKIWMSPDFDHPMTEQELDQFLGQ